MPRITNLTFTKDYKMVADALATILESATISDEYEYAGKPAIDVEGDFSMFVLEDMDTWDRHIKITVQDNSIADDTDRETKSFWASMEPRLASTLFSPTIAKVYRRIEVRVRTTTITERIVDGNAVSRDEQVTEGEPTQEWEDVTREFGKIIDDRQQRSTIW